MIRLRGTVSITFDDGYLNQYTEAFPIMEKFDLTGTIYIVTSRIDTNRIPVRYEPPIESTPLNTEHLEEMHRSGWEIASHTKTHPSRREWKTYTGKKLSDELVESKFWLESRGFLKPSFAYPYGVWTTESALLVEREYGIGRTIEAGLNDHVSGRLKGVVLYDGIDPRAWITKATRDKQWLILVFHGVEQDLRPYGGWCTVSYLSNCLRMIISSSLKVKCVKEMRDNIRS